MCQPHFRLMLLQSFAVSSLERSPHRDLNFVQRSWIRFLFVPGCVKSLARSIQFGIRSDIDVLCLHILLIELLLFPVRQPLARGSAFVAALLLFAAPARALKTPARSRR